MGAFCCYENHSFVAICLKTLCSFSPTPMMLHIKFDQDWPTGFRDIQVQKCEIFVTQGQVTPKWVVWFGPKSNSIELLCLSWLPATLMMIRSKMNELAWRHHFLIISIWEIFRRSRAANFVVSGPIWPKFELVRDFMHVLVTCKYKKDRIKSNREIWKHPFPHYKLMRPFCCYGHQSFNPICLKTSCSLSPPPVMLHSDIQVRKCKIFVIQRQGTPKWVVWSGPKSNSSELLCLSWLPATLMMIRTKMNELAWRQHFPIISIWKIFRRSRAANSVVSGPIWLKFELVRDFIHVLVTCKYKKDPIKNNWEKVETSFSPL